MHPLRRIAGLGFAFASILIVGACAQPSSSTSDPEQPGAAPVQQPCMVCPWNARLRLDGRVTTVEVHPSQGAATAGAVILAHGFLRSRATMRGHAQALSSAGFIALAPDLPFLVDSRANAQALRDLVAMLQAGRLDGRAIPAGLPVVLVGFSAGGLAALLASDAAGVVGYIGLDPFDRPGHPGRDFARTLQTPSLLIFGGPSACNAYGIARPWAEVLPRLADHRLLALATHCDFESPTDWLCRLICGAPTPAIAQSIQDALVAGVVRFVAPAPTACENVQ
jgi:dienelactone hydrolase